MNGQFQFRCNYYAIGALYGTDTSDSAVSNCNVAVAGLNAELGSQFVRTSTCALIIRTRPPLNRHVWAAAGRSNPSSLNQRPPPAPRPPPPPLPRCPLTTAGPTTTAPPSHSPTEAIPTASPTGPSAPSPTAAVPTTITVELTRSCDALSPVQHCVLSNGRYGGGYLYSYHCDADVQTLEAALPGLDFSCYGGVGQVRLSASGTHEDCSAAVGQLNTYIAAAPPPSPPPTTQQQAGLMVTSRHGAAVCALVNVTGYPTGHCVTTGDGDYSNQEACTVHVLNAGTLSATGTFATERSIDFLSIGGRHFTGTSGPSNVAVAAGSSFYWTSSRYGTGAGWTICLTASQPPTGVGESFSPTPAPTTQTEPVSEGELTCGGTVTGTTEAADHTVGNPSGEHLYTLNVDVPPAGDHRCLRIGVRHGHPRVQRQQRAHQHRDRSQRRQSRAMLAAAAAATDMHRTSRSTFNPGSTPSSSRATTTPTAPAIMAATRSRSVARQRAPHPPPNSSPPAPRPRPPLPRCPLPLGRQPRHHPATARLKKRSPSSSESTPTMT